MRSCDVQPRGDGHSPPALERFEWWVRPVDAIDISNKRVEIFDKFRHVSATRLRDEHVEPPDQPYVDQQRLDGGMTLGDVVKHFGVAHRTSQPVTKWHHEKCRELWWEQIRETARVGQVLWRWWRGLVDGELECGDEVVFARGPVWVAGLDLHPAVEGDPAFEEPQMMPVGWSRGTRLYIYGRVFCTVYLIF